LAAANDLNRHGLRDQLVRDGGLPRGKQTLVLVEQLTSRNESSPRIVPVDDLVDRTLRAIPAAAG
jgi:hypothetical protein